MPQKSNYWRRQNSYRALSRLGKQKTSVFRAEAENLSSKPDSGRGRSAPATGLHIMFFGVPLQRAQRAQEHWSGGKHAAASILAASTVCAAFGWADYAGSQTRPAGHLTQHTWPTHGWDRRPPSGRAPPSPVGPGTGLAKKLPGWFLRPDPQLPGRGPGQTA